MFTVSPTDDPIKDFARYDAEQAELLKKLPRCADCDEPIQDDYYYLINDECICPDCIDSYRKDIGDYIE